MTVDDNLIPIFTDAKSKGLYELCAKCCSCGDKNSCRNANCSCAAIICLPHCKCKGKCKKDNPDSDDSEDDPDYDPNNDSNTVSDDHLEYNSSDSDSLYV